MAIHLELGSQAEQLVAHHLEKQGFAIVDQNYKKKFGEVDLIALKADLLIFVEVKMRSKSYFDSAELITRSKQRKIINVAHEYISRHKHYDKTCRFDVALVELQENNPHITYLPNAFGD